MHLTNYPIYVSLSQYDSALAGMVDRLKRQPGIHSIYQLGSVSTPGVSDLDMLVLFEDEAECRIDPLDALSKTDRYLFAHSPYGARLADFREAQPYTIFHNYRHLWGRDVLGAQAGVSRELSQTEYQVVKTQVALEYLLKMYINVTVERAFGVIRVRSLLLLVKALRYDLDLLGIGSGELFDLIQQVIEWRSAWFKNPPRKRAILSWYDRFYKSFCDTLSSLLENKTLYIPVEANLEVARNIVLEKAAQLGYRHSGFTLPSCFGWLGKKYINVQYRFNRFTFAVPFVTADIPAVLAERFVRMQRTNNYIKQHTPHFLVPASSLRIF